MRIHQLLGLGLLILGLSACTGRPVPMSAQAGSTILIPYTNPLFGSGKLVGYGGTEVVDYQRGTLIFQLDGPGGFELVTRGATAVQASQAAAYGDVAQIAPPQQLAVLVDIPANAPLGTHSLHVLTRRIEGGVPVDHPAPFYPGTIQILPNQVTAGAEVVTGTPTPFQSHVCLFSCNWNDVSANIPSVTPRPELHLGFDPAPASFELRVDYPAGVIDVVGAFQAHTSNVASNHRGLVWFDDDGLGTVTISGAATTPGTLIPRVAMVFDLDDGANAILDETAVTLTVIKATDEDGVPITTTADTAGIF